MYIIASLFFVLGIAAGGVYGFMVKKTAMDIIFFMIAGGFAGSAAGGLIFIYLYITGIDEETVDDKKDAPELSDNSNDKINYLPEQPHASIDIKTDRQEPDIKSSFQDDIIKTESDRQKIKRLKKEIKKLKKDNLVKSQPPYSRWGFLRRHQKKSGK